MTDRLYRQSDIGTFLWCRRNYSYSVNRRLRPVYPAGEAAPCGTMHLGSLVHEAVYRHGIGELAEPHVRALARKLAWPQDPECDSPLPKDWADGVEKAMFWYKGWVKWTAEYGTEVGLQTVALEERLYVPMGSFHGDEVTLTMKPDRLMYDENLGAYIVDDIKTVSPSDVGSVQTHNRQLMTYAIGIRTLQGVAPQYLSTTQIAKSMRTKGGPLSRYFHRSQLYITPEMYNVHWDELYRSLSEMVRLDQALDRGETGVALQNPGRDCGWRCRYEDLCVTHNYGGDVERMISNDYRITAVEEDG